MAKKIPMEQLIALYNRIELHPPRSSERKKIAQDFSHYFGVSESTVRRQLRQHFHSGTSKRIDTNIPRVLTQTEMLMYCRIIAALKVRTSNKKNRHLSTPSCIKLLEEHGVETAQGLIQAPIGTLKKTTVNRYLKQWGYDSTSMKIEPAVIRFEAENSNDCWQFDFSPSDLKRFSNSENKTLFIASVADDKSGALYSEYIQTHGEDALTALKFLFNAMSPKKVAGSNIKGIPGMIYTDNGAFSRSKIFKRALLALGIELKTHMPKSTDGRRTTARSKGKIERTNRTVKKSFETLFHLHQPKNIQQANEWLANYLRQYNDMSHRSESCSRIQAWKRFLPSKGFREMCAWDKFCQFVRAPEVRLVSSDACISIDGIKFQLTSDMAGCRVTLLLGVFDNEMYVEFKDKKYGPFYPNTGPIPLHTFKRHPKSKQEKKADDITHLAQTLSVPLSVMTGKVDQKVITNLTGAQAIQQEQISIPFENDQPKFFDNRLEAKQAISHFLGRPLAQLNSENLAYINNWSYALFNFSYSNFISK